MTCCGGDIDSIFHPCYCMSEGSGYGWLQAHGFEPAPGSTGFYDTYTWYGEINGQHLDVEMHPWGTAVGSCAPTIRGWTAKCGGLEFGGSSPEDALKALTKHYTKKAQPATPTVTKEVSKMHDEIESTFKPRTPCVGSKEGEAWLTAHGFAENPQMSGHIFQWTGEISTGERLVIDIWLTHADRSPWCWMAKEALGYTVEGYSPEDALSKLLKHFTGTANSAEDVERRTAIEWLRNHYASISGRSTPTSHLPEVKVPEEFEVPSQLPKCEVCGCKQEEPKHYEVDGGMPKDSDTGQKTVDNFGRIRKVLKFDDPDKYYFVEILVRRKDQGNTSQNKDVRVVETAFIDSLEKFDRLTPVIKRICEERNARAYINLNRKSYRKTTTILMQECLSMLQNDNYNRIKGKLDSAAGQCKPEAKDRRFLIDLDTKNAVSFGQIVQSIKSLGKDCDCVLPTVNGYHFIVEPLNTRRFMESVAEDMPTLVKDDKVVEIKHNSPTLLYYRKKD